jgi:lipopolysaccharide export system protein LptA
MLTRGIFPAFILWGVLILPCAALAQEAPVEISAAKSLEWNRAAKTYTAFGDVVAKKGISEIHSDRMTAFYKNAKGSTDISGLEATGHVVISSPPYKGYGDKGSYDVKSGNAVLTGKNLRVETETEHLTAQDKIEFFSAENRLTAEGGADVVKGTQRLQADTLTAFFVKDTAGKTTTRTITAEGHVSITTEKETLEGDLGVYDVPARKAVLTGKVKIHQGKSWLEGTRAIVDMETGISQLFAEDNKATEGRVKGVFYPQKKMQQP